MLDHVSMKVSDYQKSKAFYEKALGAIGFQVLMEIPASVTGDVDVVGFGQPPKAELWISQSTPNRPALHVAFTVKDRKLVDAFFQAALAAGGTDNGAPGPRPHYHENYYGSFVLDPDGHNIEVVCHDKP